MDKSNSTTMYSSYTGNENVASAKDFVRELKVCTLDPARYLQRCIALSTRGSSEYADSYVTPNIPKGCLQSTGTLRNICISKRSFISEKPDHGMITNIITSRAPCNYYIPQTLPKYSTLTPGVNTNMGYNYLTKLTGMGADNKTEALENPKTLLLKMLHSAVISAKKKRAAHLKSKKRKTKKKKHLKNRRSSPHKKGYFSKDKKRNNSVKTEDVKFNKASENNTKAVSSISLQNVINKREKSPPKNSKMIDKMLEETEEMLRITFLSNIRCSSNASTTPAPEFDFLEKSSMFQLVNNFISNLLYCAQNKNIDEINRQSFISTTVTTKSKKPMKKGLTNSQSRVSANCKRKDIGSASERKLELGRDHSGKSKTRQKKDRSIGFGKPGKDDTEEAELAHCTVQPDPPSAISAPYRERYSSTKPISNSLHHRESITSMKSDVDEEIPSYTSNYLQRYRDPIQDHGNMTKLLPEEYNSQITYVCPSRELFLKVKEAVSATGNGDKSGLDLSAESQEVSATPVKKSVEEQKCKTIQSVEKKTNISRSIARIVSKSSMEMRSLHQRKVSDTSKFSESAMQIRKPPALRSNNKQIFKKKSERKLLSNAITKTPAKPRASCSFTSTASRYQRQQRRFRLPRNDNTRLNAVASAERRFFNRNEHLLFLARPNTRYAEHTKQRYGSVLDQYHVRNLNTIIFCNQAEDNRLKQKREALDLEEFIQEKLRENSLRVFDEVPGPPNVSEASSSNGSGSEHSFGTEPDKDSDLTENVYLQDISREELRRKSVLSIIEEEPEDVEDSDKFYVSIFKKRDKYLNISSFIFDGKEVVCSETTAQGVGKTASLTELDYRVSDRFQTEDQAIDVDEIKNENRDVLVLGDPEVASEESEGPAQNTVCVSTNADVSLPPQLYKSTETVASNTSTFITVFEGMELTLKDMQENCRYRSIGSRNYITQEEIQDDCTQALLRAKEFNLGPQKCFAMNNSIQVMRCELFFTDSTLAVGTDNLYNKHFDILCPYSEEYTLGISDTEERNAMWNKLITVNINYNPFFIKLDYYFTVLDQKSSKLLQKLINDPNVLNFATKFTKLIDNARNNSVEYDVSDPSMSMTDCNPITHNIISLLLLKVFESVKDEDSLLDMKSAMPEERILIESTNRSFGVDTVQTEVFNGCQSIRSKELVDCIPRPLIATVKFPTGDAGRRIEVRGTEMDQTCNDSGCSPTLQNTTFEHTIRKVTHYNALKKDILNNNDNTINDDIKQDNSTTPECTSSKENIFDDACFKVAHGFDKTTLKEINAVLKNLSKTSKVNKKGTRCSEDSHFSDSHNIHRMLWTSSSGDVNGDLNSEPKEISGKAASEEITNKVRKGEESACYSKQPVTPSFTLNRVSDITQIDIPIEEKETCPEREKLKIGNASLDVSSSKQHNRLSNTIKFAFLAFSVFCAASLLPAIPAIKPAIQQLINTYIIA